MVLICAIGNYFGNWVVNVYFTLRFVYLYFGLLSNVGRVLI